MSKTNLVKNRAGVTTIENYIQWQMGLSPDQQLSDEVIRETVKTVFDAMLNAGDVFVSDGDYVLKCLAESKKASKVDLVEEVQSIVHQNLLKSAIETVHYKEQTLLECLSVENLVSVAQESNIDNETVQLLALIKTRRDLDKVIHEKIKPYVSAINSEMKDMLNKYGKSFPVEFTTMMQTVFDK